MPFESQPSLKSVVSYVGGAAVVVCVIPSPPFGYLQVFGISPFGVKIENGTTQCIACTFCMSTAWECLSIP